MIQTVLPSHQGGLFNLQTSMKQITFSSFRALALGGALVVSGLSLPAFGADTKRQPKDPCATLESRSSTTTARGTGSQSSTVVTSTDRNGTRSEDCRVVNCGPSSTVTAGPGGLSGSSSIPGGSSVTVQTRNGASGSSTASASSSSSSGGSSAVAGAGQGEDCVITVNPATKDRKLKQQKR